jgi:colanic acid/amylovoran biosynthesis glycosyltransferase
MKTANPLIITGMHLSGASIVGQALFQAGLFLGDKIQVPRNFGPAGSFEDEDIARFHDEILAINKSGLKAYGTLNGLIVPTEYKNKGEELIRVKYDSHSRWGWKDPRTILFLDYWNLRLPDAKWIFVFRKPAEVAWSLLWRGELDMYSDNPIVRALTALRIWTNQNRRILAFSREHPDRTLLIFAPEDFEENKQDAINKIIIGRWSFDIRPIDLAAAYSPHLIKKKTPKWIGSLAHLYRPARLVLQQLKELQGSLWDQHLGNEAASPAKKGHEREATATKRVVCVMLRRKFVYSETFIQAHIRRLPAEIKLIHEKDFSLFSDSELPLLSPFERIMDALSREFGLSSVRYRNRALRRYLRREKAEVVLAEYGLTGADVVEALQAGDVPLIVHFHGYDAYRESVLKEQYSAYQQMFASAAAVIAVSRDMEQQLIALGVPHGKLFYNPCGVDTSLFAGADPALSAPVFVSVGRFVDKKAPHLTLLAFRRVVEDCPEARLIMLGDGPLLEACRHLSKALGIVDEVAFLGPRPHAEIVARMRTARGFVQHSVKTSDGDSEGTPVAVLEAGAAGLPVVSTSHAGIKEVVIHGETGFLVDEGDIDAMARYMIELAKNPDLAASLGRRAREHICGNFSMDKSIAGLWEIIESSIRKQQT